MCKRIPINKFQCPGCKGYKTVVIDWYNRDGQHIVRLRDCKDCETRFTTKEIMSYE